MSPDLAIEVARQALVTLALLIGPALLSALATGVIIGMFQAATSINEMTLSFIPKLIVLALVFVLLGSWMLDVLVSFTREIFSTIPEYISRR